MSDGLFAVVDTETTGLFPGGHDRIAEIAIVTVDRDGKLVDRWETLINPGRDLGKQSLHGIQARDIMDAPNFSDIAEELSWRLSGTAVVAHNLSFDSRFLEAEFKRAGNPLPPLYLSGGLCTMRLSHEYLPGVGRSLQDCCDSFGIDLQQAHSAGGDAEATAILLSRYMEIDPARSDWDRVLEGASIQRWADSRPFRTINTRPRRKPDQASEHFLERIVVRMPEYTGPLEHDEYLALLDRCLVDHHLSAHEEEQLVKTAHELGIGREAVGDLHLLYFDQLVDAAWSDGVLTDDEMADLDSVATMLNIPGDVAERSRIPRHSQPSQEPAVVAPLVSAGDKIVLTGDMSVPRSDLEERLRSKGYVTHSGVTKTVKLLVAADPDSLSGKARKARDYGIPVVGEEYVWKVLLTT